MILRLVVVSAFATGCQDDAPQRRAPVPSTPDAAEIRIDENAVTRMSDRRVGAYNLSNARAALDVTDGKTIETFEIAVGTRVPIGSDVYECVRIELGHEADKGGNGWVVLRLSRNPGPVAVPRTRPSR
jgi:hypothetical protein